ncbi:predicted protein [Uncinocarpus reesii 1704]|uniref:Uncharacterized protein n=1 Tax=Uncinocarpus reesii (strain UAMH 1704) TaxID=336963 RepID=C4JPD2_UNCRE|nr:uncharacterized protein UREG_04514 [Uncinocarpus reesii 1704]EEP79668.1 predicted protein [Uncinocarpus reesii 1704]
MAKERPLANCLEAPAKTSNVPSQDNPPGVPSSPLSSCPSTLPQPFSSPVKPRTSRKQQSLLTTTSTAPSPLPDNVSSDCEPKPLAPSQPSSFGTSFASSQRVIKDGQVVVTGSDGEDTDSALSLGSDYDDLLQMFVGPKGQRSPEKRTASSKWGLGVIPTTPPKYKFSLENLVEHAADDRETEANISKLKLAFQGSSDAGKVNKTPKQRSRMFRDDILASAIGENTNTDTMQRLKIAVDRTEAVDQNPATRERALLSGLVGESLAGKTLPDEVFYWILQAYRISTSIHPAHVEQMFRDLGARPDALSVQDIIFPDFRVFNRPKLRDYKYLLSALDVINGLANKLNNEARDVALKITLRLTLDEAAMRDCLVSRATQQAITSLLGERGTLFTVSELNELALGLFHTINDVALQSQLLKHICPVTPEIALFRCHLAALFFFQGKAFLDEPTEPVSYLQRMTSRLRDDRFNMGRSSSSEKEPFDYWELAAITSILNIAIDSATFEDSSLDREAEAKFNRAVDQLAEQVKITTSENFVVCAFERPRRRELGRDQKEREFDEQVPIPRKRW